MRGENIKDLTKQLHESYWNKFFTLKNGRVIYIPDLLNRAQRWLEITNEIPVDRYYQEGEELEQELQEQLNLFL
jgi:hypothetical protein